MPASDEMPSPDETPRPKHAGPTHAVSTHAEPAHVEPAHVEPAVPATHVPTTMPATASVPCVSCDGEHRDHEQCQSSTAQSGQLACHGLSPLIGAAPG
jgi:hypothetical protein